MGLDEICMIKILGTAGFFHVNIDYKMANFNIKGFGFFLMTSSQKVVPKVDTKRAKFFSVLGSEGSAAL